MDAKSYAIIVAIIVVITGLLVFSYSTEGYDNIATEDENMNDISKNISKTEDQDTTDEFAAAPDNYDADFTKLNSFQASNDDKLLYDVVSHGNTIDTHGNKYATLDIRGDVPWHNNGKKIATGITTGRPLTRYNYRTLGY